MAKPCKRHRDAEKCREDPNCQYGRHWGRQQCYAK
jgi:hypothetical protein